MPRQESFNVRTPRPGRVTNSKVERAVVIRTNYPLMYVIYDYFYAIACVN
jgi:multidrug resistance efflux pump